MEKEIKKVTLIEPSGYVPPILYPTQDGPKLPHEPKEDLDPEKKKRIDSGVYREA